MKALAFGALLLAGCPVEDPLLDAPFALQGPFAVSGRVAWVDGPRHEVHLLTPDLGGRPRHDVVGIGRAPGIATADLAGERLLVLTHGTRGAPGIPEEEEALWAVDPSSATAERFEVSSPFTAIGRHPDGHRLFLHFDSTAVDRPELVYNALEVATLDLDLPPSPTNPLLRTVRSFGGVPTRAIFAPEVRIDGEVLHFVAVLATNWVTLLDLDHPERSEVSIPLTLERASDAIDPIEVVVSQPDPGVDPVVYVSASGSTDVFAYTLRTTQDVSTGGHHFQVAPNLYAVGAVPTDLAPVTLEGGEALLVATGAPTLWLVDTTTSEASPIALEAPVQRIVPVGPDGAAPTEILLFGESSNVVHFVRLEGLADSVAREIDVVALPAPVSDVAALPDGASAAVFHADANRSLSILRLPDRSVAALTATAPLGRTLFSSDGTLAFVAPRSAEKLSVLRVADRHPEDLRLDAVPTGIMLVGGPEVLVVTHDAPGGLVTLIDATAPSRETARMVEGFLLEGLLDRSGEDR